MEAKRKICGRYYHFPSTSRPRSHCRLESSNTFIGDPLRYAPTALDDAIIVSLDAEWFEGQPKEITELGISIIDAKDIKPESGPWGALHAMRTSHVRIKEHAHMVNTEQCPGRPDKFQFGETRFLTIAEAGVLLLDLFSPPASNGKSCRPVIFLGHAVENDIEVIKKHFNADIASLGTIAATLDTQVMAEEADIRTPYGTQISLRNLLQSFGIREKYLHTAGNDAAYTMIAAFLSASQEMVNKSSMPHLPLTTSTHLQQALVNNLKVKSRLMPQLLAGIPVFCTRCDSTHHMVNECDVEVSCDKCSSSTSHQHH